MEIDGAGTAMTQKDRTGRTISTQRMLVARMAVVAMVASLTIGYVDYLDKVHDPAASPAMLTGADAIVVLTGGRARLEPAAQLLASGFGNRLLVTGVNEKVGEEALSNALAISPDLFACCVDIDTKALDTIGNAREASAWAEGRSYQRVIVVTNDYHMPRSLTELRAQSPDIEWIRFPVSNAPLPDETLRQRADRHRVLLIEYMKYLLARLRALA